MCNVQGTLWKEIIWKEMKDNICSSNVHYQSGEADNYTDYIVRSKIDRYPEFSNKEKEKSLRLGNLRIPEVIQLLKDLEMLVEKQGGGFGSI